ncbi:MAG TPA: hypothetical protein VGV59_04925 [Pyrinomonadaceae bacterium]|nr:hypothetical protein [Pyrinomonadaceae bacterium]
MLELRRLCAITCLVATFAISAHAGVMSTGVAPDPPPPSGPSMVITEETDEVVAGEITVEDTLSFDEWLTIQSNIMQTLLSVL